MYKTWFGIILMLCLSIQSINSKSEEKASYLEIKNKKYFYWIFKKEGRKKNSSITFFFQGGPGCSSLMSVFEGCGKFRLEENSEKKVIIKKNKFRFNKLTNMVFLDFPYGVGFSLSEKTVDYPKSIETIKYDLLDFFAAFFIKHPEFSKKKIYLTAESYATRWVVDLAAFLQNTKNSFSNQFSFDITGLFLISGYLVPYSFYKKTYKFCKINNLLNSSEMDFKKEFKKCLSLIEGDDKELAANFCFDLNQKILGPLQKPFFNKYDIRIKNCENSSCYDYGKLDKLINDENFQKDNGVIEKIEGEIKKVKKINLNIFNEKILLGEGKKKWKRCDVNFWKNLKK
jgi:carboxypeptidase C (cathepsin A)